MVPCSRIGHIFKSVSHGFPEGFRLAPKVLVTLQLMLCCRVDGNECRLVACRATGSHVFTPPPLRQHARIPRTLILFRSVSKNLNRVAEVWLDDYKEIYYKAYPTVRPTTCHEMREFIHS